MRQRSALQGVHEIAGAARGEVNEPKKLTGPMGNRPVYKRLNTLEVGGCLTLLKTEWKARTSPMSTLLYSKNYRGQFLVRRLDDGTGWVIWRLK
jgi:hypothetical protein